MTMNVDDLGQLQDLLKEFIHDKPLSATSTSVNTLQQRIEAAKKHATVSTFTVTGPLATESRVLDGIQALLVSRGYNVKLVSAVW